VNYSALAPVMFRTNDERRKHGAISTVLGSLGTLLGTIVPPILLIKGDPNSYLVMAIIIAIICLCSIIVILPGIHEDKEIINLYFQENLAEKEGFFKMMKVAVKQKNFVIYFLVYFLFQIAVVLLLQSLRYFSVFVMGSADYQVLLGIAVFGGIFIGIPIWAVVAKKLGFRKVFIVGCILMGFLMVPVLFVTEPIPVMIAMIGLGIGTAAFWVMLTPIFSDTMDEVALKTGKRKEGVYFGIRTFFGRLVLIVAAITFATVHTLTGFNEDPYSPLAILGIRIHTAFVGLVAVVIAGILLWKFYDLTPEKMSEIKAQLKELEL
jgi:GPH family glycoside/pentoside/hexuronide:cation symporter